MIVKPFIFTSRLRSVDVGFDIVPFVDFALLLVFFAWLGSPFIVAPGLTVNLPVMRAPEADAVPTSRVLTVGEVEGRELIIYDNRIHTLDTLAEALGGRGGQAADGVLLLRLQRDVSVQLLIRINELAAEAGFAAVQIAAEPERAAPSGVR